MSFIEMLPYHVVPLFGVKKTHTSTALAAVERDNVAAPPGNTNDPPAHATVRLGVASFVRISVNDEPRLELALEFDSVKVQLPVSVAVKTLPKVRSIVAAVPELPNATTLSE